MTRTGALADRHVDDVAALPELAASLDLGDGQEARLLALQIHSGDTPEAERARILRDRGAPDLESGLIEEDVAGLDHRPVEVDRAVAALLPVLEGPGAQVELPATVHAVEGRERPLLQACRRHHDLEDRARRVLRLERAIEHRVVGITHDGEPRVTIDRPREAVDGEGRRRRHRQDVAVSRIHHDDRSGATLQGLLRGLLDAPVDRGDDLGARMGLRLLDEPDRPSHRVDLDALAAVAAPEILVEQPFEPGLSDHVAAPVPALLQLLVIRFAHVAEQVGGEPTRGIGSLGLHLHDDAGELELPFLDLCHIGQRQPPAYADGDEGVGRHARHRILEVPVGNAQERGDAAQRRPASLGVALQFTRDQ